MRYFLIGFLCLTFTMPVFFSCTTNSSAVTEVPPPEKKDEAPIAELPLIPGKQDSLEGVDARVAKVPLIPEDGTLTEGVEAEIVEVPLIPEEETLAEEEEARIDEELLEELLLEKELAETEALEEIEELEAMKETEELEALEELAEEQDSSEVLSAEQRPETPEEPSIIAAITPVSPPVERPAEPSPSIPDAILGVGQIPFPVLVSFLLNINPQADRDFIEDLALLYAEEAALEGVNHDIAFAQMCLETGFLRFGGLVTPEMNNFCGLGAISDRQRGEYFPSPRIGVRAHIQHLKAYATDAPLEQELVDPRYRWVRYGSAPTIAGLAGTWAVDRAYAEKIKHILRRLYTFSTDAIVDATADTSTDSLTLNREKNEE